MTTTKNKIISLFTLLLLASAPVYAGKGGGGAGGPKSGGGGPKGGGSSSGGVTLTPPVILSLQIESSRRIHVITQQGSDIRKIRNYRITDLATNLTQNYGCGLGFGCDLADARIEGVILKPSRAYSIIALDDGQSSAPKSFIMPADAPESNAPVIGALASQTNPYLSLFPYVSFDCGDDTAVQGYRIALNGQVIADRQSMSDIMSIWSAAGVAPAFGGQRCGVYLSMIDSTTGLSYLDSHLGQVVDVSIEVFDVYGNVSEKSGQVQFYAPPQ